MSDPLAVQPQNKVLALGDGPRASRRWRSAASRRRSRALRELAQREFAISPQLSFIYPLVIDGFIVIATAAAFTMKKRGPRVTWYPWAALIVFERSCSETPHTRSTIRPRRPGLGLGPGGERPRRSAPHRITFKLVMMIDGKSQARSRQRLPRPRRRRRALHPLSKRRPSRCPRPRPPRRRTFHRRSVACARSTARQTRRLWRRRSQTSSRPDDR